MASVFINYRRSDSAVWVNKLFEHLSMRFGRDLVFEDVVSIPFGAKWMEAIRQEINHCDVFWFL